MMKVLVAVEPSPPISVAAMTAWARLCQEKLQHDPFARHGVRLRNRKGTAVKVLMYDVPGVLALPQAAFTAASFPDGPRPVPTVTPGVWPPAKLAVLLS